MPTCPPRPRGGMADTSTEEGMATIVVTHPQHGTATVGLHQWESDERTGWDRASAEAAGWTRQPDTPSANQQTKTTPAKPRQHKATA
jgi:hypothetical protein